MGEKDYEYLKDTINEEILNLCGINERFDNEPIDVKTLRLLYLDIMSILIQNRNDAGRSEAGRNFNIAITELENSCIRAIKGVYSIKK